MKAVAQLLCRCQEDGRVIDFVSTLGHPGALESSLSFLSAGFQSSFLGMPMTWLVLQRGHRPGYGYRVAELFFQSRD